VKNGIVARIAGGYIEALRGWAAVLFVAAACGAASLLITLPLWFFAVRSPEGYSVFIAAVALGTVAVSAFLFLRRRRLRDGLSVLHFLRIRVLPGFLLTLLLLAGAAVGLILLAMRRFLFLAAFLLGFLLLFGWLRYGRRRA
jgi:hypothetical protein